MEGIYRLRKIKQGTNDREERSKKTGTNDLTVDLDGLHSPPFYCLVTVILQLLVHADESFAASP